MSQTKAQLINGKSATIEFTGGSASAPAVSFTGDTNTGIYSPGSDQLAISTNSSQRLLIDASGNVNIDSNTLYVDATNNRVGIGTSSPSATTKMSIVDSTSAGIYFLRTAQGETVIENTGPLTIRQSSGNGANQNIFFKTGASVGTEVTAMTIDGSQRVGIGTTSPSYALDVASADTTAGIGYALRLRQNATAGAAAIQFTDNPVTTQYGYIACDSSSNLKFAIGLSERARIDSSGRLLVGTSSSLTGTDTQYSRLVVAGNTSGASAGIMSISRPEAATSITTDEVLGIISFADSGAGEYGRITCAADANAGTNDYPGRLVFSTTADGASSPTERMRITNNGNLLLGLTTSSGYRCEISHTNATPQQISRVGNDGNLIDFIKDTTIQGSISVSGTTVSYNGAHLSRWSQLPSGGKREEILRGTVLSNINEMCEWGDEDNEQLNRMKVSDVEGDKNVSGVFQAWDDDDDTYTNDFYCAMTGDFIIRIAQGVTVERGDLLMSAGDGTAKPQDDDIIRNKTIAKVTSTNVSCTYDDGSYCVPCVLMAC